MGSLGCLGPLLRRAVQEGAVLTLNRGKGQGTNKQTQEGD